MPKTSKKEKAAPKLLTFNPTVMPGAVPHTAVHIPDAVWERWQNMSADLGLPDEAVLEAAMIAFLDMYGEDHELQFPLMLQMVDHS